MKTTGVSDIQNFGLLDFLGHPIVQAKIESEQDSDLNCLHRAFLAPKVLLEDL